MSDDQQPEVRWAPIPPKPSRKGRIWLIVGLTVAALLIVGVTLFFLIPRGDQPDPGASASPSSSPSTPTTTPTTTPSTTATPTTEPSSGPIQTEPPVVDPTVQAFQGQVSGWLGDAGRGLDIVAGASGQDALPVIDTLQEDAQRLSDAQPPSSIDQAWRDGVAAYSQKLTALRSAVTGGSGAPAAVEAARGAAQSLRTLVGL